MAPQLPVERNLKTYLTTASDLKLEASIEYIIALLKRRQIGSSTECALATLHVLRRSIEEYKWTRDEQDLQTLIDQLLQRVREVGQKLVRAQPKELVINNMVSRVVRTVKESARVFSNTDEEAGVALRPPPAMFQLFSVSPTTLSSSQAESLDRDSKYALKSEILGGIEEDIDEVKQAVDQISSHAPEHLGSNEVILISSSSRTLQKFLLRAAEGRRFSVYFVESFPDNREGELSTMAFQQPLSAAGITFIIIPDVSVWAVMSRVDKVILTPQTVMGNGGMVAASGSHIVAKVAKKFQKPVIVLSGTHLFCADHPFDPPALIRHGDPSKGSSYQDVNFADDAEVDNPMNDYVGPDLIDIYITNAGAHAPSTGLLEQQA